MAVTQIGGAQIGGAQLVTLFSGSTTGTVTLPESAANFRLLIINAKINNMPLVSSVITDPNNKSVVLSGFFKATNIFGQYRFRTVRISGKSITTESAGYFNVDNRNWSIGGSWNDNGVQITSVVGVR